MKRRRHWLLAVLALALCWVSPARADFPDRTVHFVVPYAPGGLTDLLARILAQKLGEKWGQSVVVENRPGGNGTVAEGLVARAAPDGYTVIVVLTAHTVAPSDSQYKLSYDPIKGFEPIMRLGSTPELLVVNPNVLPVSSVKELIAVAKSRPKAINFGSAGTYTPGFLNMALFMQATGTEMVNVSFQGSGPAFTSLLGGEVQLTFATMAEALAQSKAGKLRALAVSGSRRSPLAPEIPTVLEAFGAASPEIAELLGAETAWYGALTTGGTPREVVARLHDDMAEALRSPDVQAKLAAQSFQVDGGPSSEFAAFISRDIAKWTELRKTGVIH